MDSYFVDAVIWFARGAGVVSGLLLLIGFMFREKWKQMLQRSLSSDLERLKSELSRENAAHAASLIPALERIKHDYQQQLEAYKVGLISQAEAAKAAVDLKKTVALRYAEIEFERLVTLELRLAPIATSTCARGALSPEQKTLDQFQLCWAEFQALTVAVEQAEMFLTLEERGVMLAFRRALTDFTVAHIGVGKPTVEDGATVLNQVMRLNADAHHILKERIKALGAYPPIEISGSR